MSSRWPLKETIEYVPKFHTSDPVTATEIIGEVGKVPSAMAAEILETSVTKMVKAKCW